MLHLKTLHEGKLLVPTPSILKALKSLENQIIYGYPNYENVRNLILKRGFISREENIIPISSNKIIEENLGSIGMLCVEDIVSEIFNQGKNA